MLLVMSAAGRTLPSTTCSVVRLELNRNTVLGAMTPTSWCWVAPALSWATRASSLVTFAGVKNWSMVALPSMVNMTTMAWPPNSCS